MTIIYNFCTLRTESPSIFSFPTHLGKIQEDSKNPATRSTIFEAYVVNSPRLSEVEFFAFHCPG